MTRCWNLDDLDVSLPAEQSVQLDIPVAILKVVESVTQPLFEEVSNPVGLSLASSADADSGTANVALIIPVGVGEREVESHLLVEWAAAE